MGKRKEKRKTIRWIKRILSDGSSDERGETTRKQQKSGGRKWRKRILSETSDDEEALKTKERAEAVSKRILSDSSDDDLEEIGGKNHRAKSIRQRKRILSDSSDDDLEEIGGKNHRAKSIRQRKRILSDSSDDDLEEIGGKNHRAKSIRQRKRILSDSSDDDLEEIGGKNHRAKSIRQRKRILSDSSDDDIEEIGGTEPRRGCRKMIFSETSSSDEDLKMGTSHDKAQSDEVTSCKGLKKNRLMLQLCCQTKKARRESSSTEKKHREKMCKDLEKMQSKKQPKKENNCQKKGQKRARREEHSPEQCKKKIRDQNIEVTDSQHGQQRSGENGVSPACPGATASLSIQRFQFHHELGRGNFGKVLLATDTITSKRMAIKVMKKSSLLEEGPETALLERTVLQIAAGSPFLMSADFAFQTEEQLFIGMEYAHGGDLFQLLEKKGRLDSNTAIFYAAELVCGLQYLHARGVIHRDLKPENILLTREGHLKIADFGLAIDNMFGDRTATGHAGTPDFIAPEVLLGREYNASVDWFSFGVVLLEMTTGDTQIKSELFKGKGGILSSDAKDILQKLLCEDPSKRLGVNGCIRNHPFFRGIEWVELEALRLKPPFIPSRPFRKNLGHLSLERVVTSGGPAAWNTPISSMDQQLFQGFSFESTTWRPGLF